jgi:hypothetical protein
MDYKIKVAVCRILDSVWTVIYQLETEETEARILHYSRDVTEGYEHERELPTFKLIESDERIFIGLEVDGVMYNVVNQKHIFSYC